MNKVHAVTYETKAPVGTESLVLLLLGITAFTFLTGRTVQWLNMSMMPVGYAYGVCSLTYLLWAYTKIIDLLRRNQRSVAQMCMCVIAVSIFAFNASPANAQFLNGAEALFGGFPGIDQTLVDVVFNLLRVALIIAFAVSLLPAFNAARDGDDWKTLAKTPVLAAVLVAVSDVVVGIIIGGAGA